LKVRLYFKMKILVTGATGGFGKLMIPELLRAGHEIIATSRHRAKAEKLPFFKQVIYIPYDIDQQSTANLYDHFGQPDSMIHLAWDKLHDYNDDEHLSGILNSHKAFLFNLVSHGLKDFNGLGTCYEYGLKEGELREEDESEPVLPYSRAKNSLRLYVESLKEQYGLSVKWLRIFYVFGETGGRKNLYNALMDAVLNNEPDFNMSAGEQVRDFLGPEEMAELLVKASLQTKVQGIINCCSGTPVKLKDFITGFLKKNQYTIRLNLGHYPYLAYEPMESWGSVKKLNSIIIGE
jgi:nucleoside-diphosphate-sugar epimerase